MKTKFGSGLKMKFIIFLFLASHFSLSAEASQNNWDKVAEEIEKALNNAAEAYEKGKKDEAMEMVADAYFGIFEGEKANMEIAVRRFLSLKKASELEKGFADLRKGIKDGIKPSDFKKQTSNLVETVKTAAKELDRKGVGLSSEL
ncbi:MAG: hypothetical protein Q7T53_00305 [Deltaproteobacteria bacterium]|nr:hypothetical protein [Deltaproteobacteria bacterium]